MKHLMNRLTALTLALLLVLALAACGGKDTASGDGPFTNMETTDLDGSAVDSSVFADNKLTMVNVWNLGCSPCVQEIPHLGQLHKDYADKGVAVMGLYYNFGEELSEGDRKEIDDIMTSSNADYPQILCSASMMEHKSLGQIEGFPTTFFVDSEGNVVDVVDFGGNVVNSVLGSNDYEGWAKIIDQALEKIDG